VTLYECIYIWFIEYKVFRYVMEISEKWIRHYSSTHKILLVGEGNFSFSLCLASAFGSAMNITATSLDSEGM